MTERSYPGEGNRKSSLVGADWWRVRLLRRAAQQQREQRRPQRGAGRKEGRGAGQECHRSQANTGLPHAQGGSALPANIYHIDVAALVVGWSRPRRVHEAGGLVQGDRRRELAVALEKELARLARAILRDDGLDELAPDAEALVAGRDRHLRELEAPIARIEQRAGADDRAAVAGEKNGAAAAQDALRLREHLLVDGLDAEVPLQPFDVEPLEIGGVAPLERNDLHRARAFEP